MVCRLPAVIDSLAPGGTAKEVSASDAEGLFGSFKPCSLVEHTPHQLARELLEDVHRLDRS